MSLIYEITDNGYHIYDTEDPLFHIHQYEPFIPNPSITYEENALMQIADIDRGKKMSDYLHKLNDNVITMNDVPAEYYNDVYALYEDIEAVESDYQAALEEMGVEFNEEE